MTELNYLSFVSFRPNGTKWVRRVVYQDEPSLVVSLLPHAIDVGLPFVVAVQLIELYDDAQALCYGIDQWEASFRHEKVISRIAQNGDRQPNSEATTVRHENVVFRYGHTIQFGEILCDSIPRCLSSSEIRIPIKLVHILRYGGDERWVEPELQLKGT